MPAIETNELTRSYKGRERGQSIRALDGLSLRVDEGECMAC